MVTPSDIADEMGVVTPDSSSPTYRQWQRWIDSGYRAVRARAARTGVDYDSLESEDVDEVVVWAVVRRASRPSDGATSVTEQGSVDDVSAQDTRRYPESQGDLFFLDKWWDRLGLILPSGGWSGSLAYTR